MDLRIKIFFALSLGSIAIACGRPTDENGSEKGKLNSTEENGEYGNHFEGDIILSQEQINALKYAPRNGLIDPSTRWPEATVVYEIGRDLKRKSHLIKDAMKTISSVSCIKFKERTNERAYVHFNAQFQGCFGYVGYQRKVQPLNLGSGCLQKGVIMHEILHTLGFLHMQSAYDRDDYIDIQWENIQPKANVQFKKHGSNVLTYFGGTYDYDSIMHYPADAFTKNGKLTMKTKDSSKQSAIGNRRGMSEHDILKLNKMYKC